MKAQIFNRKQIEFLGIFRAIPFLGDNFYLTGGTALADFYLQHRYSEDLDFFSEKEIDILGLNVALKKIKGKMKVTKSEFQQSYNRNLYFLYFGREVLKTEFTYFPFPRIKKLHSADGISIDSLEDIAVNKLFTIYQRVAARDYIDLYCILKNKQFKMANLIKQAKSKFDWHIDPIQLGSQFLKSKDAEDLPKMIKDVPKKEWRRFFLEEAKKLKKEIIL